MVRFAAIVSLFILVGCADQSKGAALGECRLKYYLEDPGAQGEAIPDCMRAKSFQTETACGPETNDNERDWQMRAFTFDNPKCYRPVDTAPWLATLLSPM
jgi:hypothetical protein